MIRLADDRYCAPCGILYWQATDAQAHRRELHPEQARHERTPDTTFAAEVNGTSGLPSLWFES